MARKSSIVRSRRSVAQINVVPYIDVMLVLLIIFMITAPLLQTGIDVDLPQAEAKTVEQNNQKPVVITIDKSVHYYLNRGDEKKPKTLAELYAFLRILKEEQSIREVLVKSDRRVAYGDFVKVMALAKKAGIEKVGLLTETME